MSHNSVWTLEAFQFSDVDLIFPADDAAVIAHNVHQTSVMADNAAK